MGLQISASALGMVPRIVNARTFLPLEPVVPFQVGLVASYGNAVFQLEFDGLEDEPMWAYPLTNVRIWTFVIVIRSHTYSHGCQTKRTIYIHKLRIAA